MRSIVITLISAAAMLCASSAHACGFGYSTSSVSYYSYAPQVAYVQLAYVAPVAVAAPAPCANEATAYVAAPSYGASALFVNSSYGYEVNQRAFFINHTDNYNHNDNHRNGVRHFNFKRHK